MHRHLTRDQLNKVVLFCAEEVQRQQDTPTHVAYMLHAWFDALDSVRAKRPLDLAMIEQWGRLVSPNLNPHGFRSVGVQVGRRICPPAVAVPYELQAWLHAAPGMKPDNAYFDFEMIHPFRDGNGRVGKIVFNYLKGTLADPVMPTNFWGISNP